MTPLAKILSIFLVIGIVLIIFNEVTAAPLF